MTKPLLSYSSPIYRQGFTLIEVLVALAIFAVLSLTGWKVFDGVIKVREHNQVYTDQLSSLQSAYTLMLRDMSQIVARPARQGSQNQPALLIENQKISFSRMAGFDPTGQQQANLERVSYEYNSGTQQLIRTSYYQPDQTRALTPPKSVILEKITNFTVKALDPAPSDQWPANMGMAQPLTPNQPLGNSQLPSGVEIQFNVNERPILWRFSLIKKLPDPVPEAKKSP